MTQLLTWSSAACFYAAHAAKVPGLIFLSGQTPVNAEGILVEGGIKEHTVGVLC